MQKILNRVSNQNHNVFNGSLPDLLNLAIAGAQYEKGAPKSAIIRDFQQKLTDLNPINITLMV